MDRENRISTKPVDRVMLKELCRYLDRFWRPKSEPADETPRSEMAHRQEILYDMEVEEDAGRRRGLCAEPPKKRMIPFGVMVGGGLWTALKSRLNKKEETCSERLLRMIRERGLDEVEVYKKAGIDRKLFSKMRRRDYRPKATTLYAFIIVLNLNLDDATDLLASAGYAFSPAEKLDLVVRFFVERGAGDLDEVNGALYELELATLP